MKFPSNRYDEITGKIRSKADKKMKDIRCVVAAINSNGDPDFYFVKVKATEEQINNGDHYDAARESAEDEGYEALLTYDQNDYGWKAFSRNAFDWKTAPVVTIE